MTPRDPSENLIRRLTTWLPRLADPASVAQAAEAMWSAQLAAVKDAPKTERDPTLTREQKDARELESYAAALTQLHDQLDALFPACVDRYLELQRAAHADQLRREAAIEARTDLPDIDFRAITTATQVRCVLHRASTRTSPRSSPPWAR